ncbi:MAG: ROK family protein [Bacteriovoracaceae bacterium]|nr:ROK family protein [Bacteriovoracaceae bacterium]
MVAVREFNQKITLKVVPPLDPEFRPAALWRASFNQLAQELHGPTQVIAIMREHQTIFSTTVTLLPLDKEEYAELNFFFVERTCKYLLWSKGGHTIFLPGQKALAARLQNHYQTVRQFDQDLIGEQVYGQKLRFTAEDLPAVPAPHFPACKKQADGNRVGIDLGGSDRKFAAIKDGEVVHTGEIIWNPYHQPDPHYHLTEIDDCIAQAAKYLDRVDAIGVSSAGIYVANEVKVGSLFRGVSKEDFKNKIAPLFKTLQKKWNNVPLVVANDGDVTALAAAYSSGQVPVLGVAMGTSLAAGYINEN